MGFIFRRLRVASLVVFVCLSWSCTRQSMEQPVPLSAEFTSVLSIIKSRCTKCHDNFEFKSEKEAFEAKSLGGVPLFVAGKPEQSLLVRRLRYSAETGSTDADQGKPMPPSGYDFSKAEYETIRNWILSKKEPDDGKGSGSSGGGQFADPSFKCDPNATELVPTTLKRLSKSQYQGVLNELLSTLSASERATIQSLIATEFQSIPEDEGRYPGREDNRVLAAHYESMFNIANIIAQYITSSSDRTMRFTDVCSSSGNSTSTNTIFYQQGFDNLPVGADPSGWYDTEANNRYDVRNEALFKTMRLGNGSIGIGTTNGGTNINSHYIGGNSGNLRDYELSATISRVDGAAGLTIYSDYPNSDTYYRIRYMTSDWSNSTYRSAWIANHPDSDQLSGDCQTSVVPKSNVPYQFRFQAFTRSDHNLIRAKIWEKGSAEPAGWDVDCQDRSSFRPKQGTFGVWAYEGNNGIIWDDFKVTLLGAPPSSNLTGLACADSFIEDFAMRAYRRPISNAEKSDLLDLYDDTDGLRWIISAILGSPNVFIRTLNQGGLKAGTTDVVKLSDYELVNEWTFLTWGAPADRPIYELLENSSLASPTTRAQIETYIVTSPKAVSDSAVEFFSEWLKLREIANISANAPGVNVILNGVNLPSNATELARQEVRDMAKYYLSKNGTLEDLHMSDRSFARGGLEKLYQVPAYVPGQNPPVHKGDSRAGFLTTVSRLATGSADHPSPVQMGVDFVREMACFDLPPPPADLDIKPPPLNPNWTTRQRFYELTQNNQPKCAVCHDFINRFGNAFQNFDALGQDTGYEHVFNSNGDLISTLITDSRDDVSFAGVQVPVNNARDLVELLNKTGFAKNCMSQQYLHYALGREIDKTKDGCALERIRTSPNLKTSFQSVYPLLEERKLK